MFPRRVAAVFIVVALCFSLGLPAWGQYDPSPEAQNDLRLRREYLISYPGLFAFRYDPEEVTNFIPPMYWNYAHTSKGYNLSLEPEEEIITQMMLFNDFDPAINVNFMDSEAVDEYADLFFVNKVKNCQEVPTEGFFKVYYECADGLYAAELHPKSAYTISVSYEYSGKPRHKILFLKILRTFAIISPEWASETGVLHGSPEPQKVVLSCDDLKSFEVRRRTITASWHGPEDYFYLVAHSTPAGAAKIEQYLKETKGQGRDFYLENLELYSFPPKADSPVPYTPEQLEIPGEYRDPQLSVELARSLCRGVPITVLEE